MNSKTKKYSLTRDLPSVSDVINSTKAKRLLEKHSLAIVTDAARACIDRVRAKLLNTKEPQCVDIFLEIEMEIESITSMKPQRVINATGIVLHTNLGRAPMSKKALEAAIEVGSGYCDLEFDISSGKRGSRQAHIEDVICRVTGAEACYVVNNNAAAVLLCLDTLARDKEAIVSRGELVEIGGAFRVPDVMNKSGSKLVEVGTTNKTKISDYEKVITESTGILLKVHTSNFKIIGFTESVSLDDIVKLGAKSGVPTMYDLGSGLLLELSSLGYTDILENTVQSSVKSGVDLVTFSGDKLLGGPQCGIIVGKRKYIDMVAKNQLARALRVDKFTMAALFATFLTYLDSNDATEEIPILKAFKKTKEELLNSASKLMKSIKVPSDKVIMNIVEEASEAGGGSLPGVEIPGYALSISGELSCDALQKALRDNVIPIISYIQEDEVRLHLRTISEDEMDIVAKGVMNAISVIMG